MAEHQLRLGAPGELGQGRLAPGGSPIAVWTAGRLYLRRLDLDRWVWDRVPPPAGFTLAQGLGETVVLDEATPGTLVVLDDQPRAWLRAGGVTPKWTLLGGPPPQTGEAHWVNGGNLVVSRSPGGRTDLLVSTGDQQLWYRQGLDPDGTWFPLLVAGSTGPAGPNLTVAQHGSVYAEAVVGQAPQQHMFAVVNEGGTVSLRVALRENFIWNWTVPPGAPPDLSQGVNASQAEVRLSPGAWRDPSGRLLARMLLADRQDNLFLLSGAGHDWTWTSLGGPVVDDSVSGAVLADPGPDPQPGAEPVVVARLHHELWTRTVTGPWTDRGPTGGDGKAVITPDSAVVLAAGTPQERILMTGSSWRQDLWSAQISADPAVAWENHGIPARLDRVVGAYEAAADPELPGQLPVMAFVLDEYGELWVNRVWGAPGDGLLLSSDFWTGLGTPAPDVTCLHPIGAISLPLLPVPSWVFVVGSDGHLWGAQPIDPDDETGLWTWVDLGTPSGTTLLSGVGPDAVGDVPVIHALGRDGRLWLRATDSPTWVDRGVPGGQLLSSVVGASVLPAVSDQPIVAVITRNGHVWLSVPGPAGFTWVDAGQPGPAERAVAVVGVAAVADDVLDVVVVGSPSDDLWTLHWVRGTAGTWSSRGRPGSQRIHDVGGIVGATAATPGRATIAVVGFDDQIWIAGTGAAGPAWTPWVKPDPDVPVATAGAAALLSLPWVLAVDRTGRLVALTG
jgi:hypothetical protein